MSTEKLIFGWITIIFIFAASIFVFWPDIGKDIVRLTKKPAISQKKSRQKAPGKTVPARVHKSVGNLQQSLAELFDYFKSNTEKEHERRSQAVLQKMRKICEFFRFCQVHESS